MNSDFPHKQVQADLDKLIAQSSSAASTRVAEVRYRIEAYKPSGKFYHSVEETASFRAPYTSPREVLEALSPPGTVPGLITRLDNCPYYLMLSPATAKDADAAERVGAPSVPCMIPPTDGSHEKALTPTQGLAEVLAELTKATSMFGPFASAHEGWAILREEVDELWDEVKKSPRKWDPAALRREAVQVAAMALRFIRDVCQ